MRSIDIRDTFLRFFVDRDHHVVPSSSLVPDDPTMLLTTAGMVQFKPYFLGLATPPAPRLTSAQRCVRTVDIDGIGRTTRHTTYFEMLGNFSFGAYENDRAVAWAYELLTDGFGLDPTRLWPTVFRDDDETVELWRSHGFPTERIQRLGPADNFWDTGGPGPCGPCSEIFYDRGPRFGRAGGPAVNPERYFEIWNLVFMRYVRGEGGEPGEIPPIVGDLPRRCIESGLGLERLAAVLQGVDSVHETDLVAPVLDEVARLVGVRFTDGDDRVRRSLRLITDHIRASTMLLADGVLPGNEGRGYVLRRLVRRAIHHGRRLGLASTAVPQLARTVITSHRDYRPEIGQQESLVETALAHEAESFERTLRHGFRVLASEIGRSKERSESQLPAPTAFRLHDTFGFPLELTVEIARESGLEVDVDHVEALLAQHRQRARFGRDRVDPSRTSAYPCLRERFGPTTFVGYDSLTADGNVVALLVDGTEQPAVGAGQRVEVVTDRTAMYAESGGQVGDRGMIRTPAGALVRVTDTVFGADDLRVHVGVVEHGELRVGEAACSEVDRDFRLAAARSHSATHVLHAMLRRHLGDHVRQHGSLVAPGRLRFDFSHFGAPGADELRALEDAVNAALLDDPEVRVWETGRDAALAAGATALFGEKYGDVVRVVDIGDFSRELCGGTHVEHGSQVGPVRILGESSVGSGLRRVEALTGVDALRHVDHEHRLLEELGALLGGARPEELTDRLRQRLAALARVERELADVRLRELDRRARQLASRRQLCGTGWVVVDRVPDLLGGADDLRALTDRALEFGPRDLPGGVLLGGVVDDKVQLVLAVNRPGLDGGIRPREVLTEPAHLVGGGAGGRGSVAYAGGRNVAGLDAALARGRQRLAELLAGTS